jgi:hypothetical protein
VVMRVYFEKPAPRWAGRATSTTRTWTAASPSTKACGWRAAAAGRAGAGPAGGHRVPGPAEPAVHQRPGELGRHRRAHHREPATASWPAA